ncbi:NTPase, partial [Escherichia coli]|nr:NTPase [Escherichia coli]
MKLFGLSKFSYQTSEYNVDNYEYAIFGIVYKYLSENSSLLHAEENIKRQWAEMSEYHFLKGGGGI